MTKNLVIVESPTKSKTIEKFLGKNYTVRASMGHLRDLPKSTFGVDIENNFEPKYINIRGKGDLIKELKALAKKADKVFLATDPDREGEAISWHLAHLLDIEPEKKCRIEFHEITSTAIKDALKHPRTIDMEKVDAQQARRIIDRIVGYKLSPLLWRKIRKGLSAGRVQSVAVKIIADREKEIADFIPQEYWTLNAKLRENSKAPIFEAELAKYKGKKLELTSEEQARAAEEALSKASYSVAEATKKERKRRAAPPFTTSSLQQEANKKLNFTAKKTMMVAQQLYEGVSLGKSSVGLITYMRTDSVRFADSARDDIRNYIVDTYGQEYCPAKPNVYSSKKNAQDAHEAIRPTSILRTPTEIANHLTKDQLKLYTLIWNRAVASQMSDAVYDVTTLLIDAGDYQLRASGAILKFPGYLQLSGKSADDEKEKQVPYLEAGTQLLLHKLLPAEQHFTEPPAHFTEATLVKELEEKGIGRPSTYAPTIQTILDRGYVAKDGKKLLTTELGLLVVDMLVKYFSGLISIPFSAEMENHLDEIAENHADKNEIIEKFYKPFSEDLEIADKDIVAVELPVEVSDVPCDKCGRMMVVKEGRFGKFLACPGFPECRNTKPILNKIGIKCPVCGGEVIERKTKTRRVFYGCENYSKDSSGCSFLSWDKPTEEKCPKCGSMMLEHIEKTGRKKLYCSNQDCSNSKPVRKVSKKSDA
ncbi:MAG: type I DNA topoisomerase [Phascolarctobacterium sp.]|nr:type I DNA topoisomerase [Phascolarctobacterium sp.]